MHRRICEQKISFYAVGEKTSRSSRLFKRLVQIMGIHDAVNLTDKLIAILCKGASEELLDLYSRQRRPVAEEEILAQSHTNRMRMQRRDPIWRAAEMTRLQALIANPDQHREHLLKSSMISGLARAAAVT